MAVEAVGAVLSDEEHVTVELVLVELFLSAKVTVELAVGEDQAADVLGDGFFYHYESDLVAAESL